jgi:hypothetical protein
VNRREVAGLSLGERGGAGLAFVVCCVGFWISRSG